LGSGGEAVRRSAAIRALPPCSAALHLHLAADRQTSRRGAAAAVHPLPCSSPRIRRRLGGRKQGSTDGDPARRHGRRSRAAQAGALRRGREEARLAGRCGEGGGTARRRCVRGGRRAEGARNRPVGEPGRRRGGEG
jgi:hypothetical protein